MMMDELKNLTALYGPSGGEEQVAEYILSHLAEAGVEATCDSLGNVLVKMGQGGRRIVVNVHMDSVALILKKIDDKGFGQVAFVGKVDAAAAVGAVVRFENGTEALVCRKGSSAATSASELYLDFGLADRNEVEKRVTVGDMAVFASDFRLMGGKAVSAALNNRGGCAVLLEAIGRIKEPKNTLFFLFSTQDIAGASGSVAALREFHGELAVSVDTTVAADTPGANKNGTASLSCGAGIRIADAGTQCSPVVIRMLQELAEDRNIKVQQDILTEGRLEGENLAKVGSGMPVGGLTIPCRHLHTHNEMVDLTDMEACAALIVALAEKEF